MAQEHHPDEPAPREQEGTGSCKTDRADAFEAVTFIVLRREFKPTEDDYLSVTLLVDATAFPQQQEGYSRMHGDAMKSYLVALRRVRPDLMEWLVAPDGSPKTHFTREERDYAKGLYDDYVLWRLKQTI
jgi:hypothetical protein